MAVFWILAALMTAVALAFVLVPLLRPRPAVGPTQADANLEVLRSQRREIEADVALGTLPAAAREQALAELVERAAADLPATPEDAAPAERRRPWGIALAVGLLVPALAFALYLGLGTPQATDATVAAAARGKVDDQQMVSLVEQLAAKVRERPEDLQGWSLLARSMAALGRFRESADAYEHLARLSPKDPQVLADWADSLGMAQGRTLKGKPAQLANQALALDPDHPKALALAGTAALDDSDYPTALRHWERLAKLAEGSPDATQVRSVISEIRQRAASAGVKLAEAPAAPQAAAAPAAATAAGTSVSGTVAIAPAMASRVKGTETLYVYARAENGPRMPLAILRGSAKQLPMSFALDDSMAMAPTAKLSGAAAVRIEARVSPSGNATPQPGDLVGTSGVVKPGARDVKIVIDKVLP